MIGLIGLGAATTVAYSTTNCYVNAGPNQFACSVVTRPAPPAGYDCAVVITDQEVSSVTIVSTGHEFSLAITVSCTLRWGVLFTDESGNLYCTVAQQGGPISTISVSARTAGGPDCPNSGGGD